jgi:hypothetical protein
MGSRMHVTIVMAGFIVLPVTEAVKCQWGDDFDSNLLHDDDEPIVSTTTAAGPA